MKQETTDTETIYSDKAKMKRKCSSLQEEYMLKNCLKIDKWKQYYSHVVNADWSKKKIDKE